jgi:ribonuclease HII
MIGIDEVGRGAWAGPLLVVAARAKTALPVGLKDSKVLTKNKREQLIPALLRSCDFGEGWVEPAEIDQIGLTGAMQLAVKRALMHLVATESDEIIMDGTINYCGSEFMNVQCIARADATHPIVSAASIYAKVLRDTKMTELSADYPEYGFEKHVGYGTKLHLEGLKAQGVTPIHRLSYKPVAVFV